MKGLEPSTSGATTRHSNHLSYTHHQCLARLQGFEPGTYGLEVRCSIQLSYRRIVNLPNGINIGLITMILYRFPNNMTGKMYVMQVLINIEG